MSAILFDTLKFSEQMEASGFTPQQAKGQAHAIAEIIDNQIASKQDIEALKLEIQREIAESKAEMVKWVVSVGILQTAVIASLLLRLVH